jgi:transposase
LRDGFNRASAALLLPSTLDLALLGYEVLTERVTLEVLSHCSSSICPLCGHESNKIHSFYHRRITDLPTGGKKVSVQLQASKFFCLNSDCVRKIFTERFAAGLSSYGRRFERLNEVLTYCGLESGGNSSTRQAGCRPVNYFAVKISASTMLRLMKKRRIPLIAAPKVIGVDDWAFKKRCTYGTIIIDLENRQVIDLLPNREANTLAKWLLKHPTIEAERRPVISRDRSTTYASAITEGSPQAVQVADRWHILKNLTETLEKFLDTQRDSIKEISVQLSKDNRNEEQKPLIEAIVIKNEESLQIEQPTNEIVPKSKYYDKLRVVAPYEGKRITS